MQIVEQVDMFKNAVGEQNIKHHIVVCFSTCRLAVSIFSSVGFVVGFINSVMLLCNVKLN